MKRLVGLVAIVALVSFLGTISIVQADDQVLSVRDSRNIVVEIDYGGMIPSKTVETSVEKNRSVLEILQMVATVETHPVGKHVMVVSIDGVKGERGKMAWYYKIDEESPEKIAYSTDADDVATIKWIYKEDACSKTVDLPSVEIEKK